MPRYYNKTRGPLPLSLTSGSTVVAAKSYVELSREDEGCASVVRYVKKDMLVPPKFRAELSPVIATAPVSAPAPAPAPIVFDEPEEPVKLEASEDMEEMPSDPEEDGDSKKTRKKGPGGNKIWLNYYHPESS